jgi:hypothetical protein
MNYMLNLAYEKSTWYQSIGLERTHCTSILHKKKEKTSLLSYMEIRAFYWRRFSASKPFRKVRPNPRNSLAPLAHLFSG